MEQASKRNVDIVCLPELCVCEEWLPLIQAVSKDMVVIAGSYYDAKRHNVCRLVIDSKVIDYSQMKINPSSLEKGTSYKSLMTSGDKLYIFKTKVGILSILICRDFLNYCHFLRDFVDIIFVPSYNREINFFQETAHVNVKASRTYVVISNTSVYGGTSLFGIVHKESHNEFIDKGFKREGDDTYKVCELEAGVEGIITADLNLVFKAIQVPSLANSFRSK